MSMRRHGDTSELWSDYMSLTIFLYSVLGSLLANVNVNIKMYINDCIRMYKIVC